MTDSATAADAGPATPDIRPFDAGLHRQSLSELIRHLHRDDHAVVLQEALGLFGRPSEDPRREDTLVATAGGTVVGVASASSSPRHARRFVSVAVHDAWRRRGTGTALLHALRSRAPDHGGEPWIARVWPHEGGAAFAGRHGFGKVMRSRAWTVDPADPEVTSWLRQRADGSLPYAVAQATTADTAEISGALGRLYRWTHESWLPVLDSPDPLIPRPPDVAFLARESGRVAGLGLLMRQPQLAEGSWSMSAGPTDPGLPAASRLTATLLLRCLEAAAAQGGSVIAGYDDSHRHLVPLLEAVPGATLIAELHFYEEARGTGGASA